MNTQRDWTEIASELNYAVKNYQGITKTIVQMTNRGHAYNIDPTNEELITGRIGKDGSQKTQGLESIKGMASRKIEKVLRDFPIWSEWLVDVPGIGPAIGGQLISLYYFKSVPVCPDCGADLNTDQIITEDGEKRKAFECPICKNKAKGQGLLKYRIELRDFGTISSWWHYMGRHVADGKMPKRRSGMQSDWSSPGRTLGHHIKESFNKLPSSHKYKAYAEKRKRYREGTHPEATKGHRHNMAWNETIKLFLSHFWQVAHILDGQDMTQPWCVQHGGHDESHIIPPYYFNGDKAA
jgi:hypothetical protein